jgi:polyvinyl alcohol dehydrogenase (cytochrome)
VIRFRGIRGGTPEQHETARPGERRSRHRGLLAALGVLAATTVIAAGCNGQSPIGGASWTMWGHDYSNTHNQDAERKISTANAAQLKPKWVAELKGDISATATVADGTVYVPDWGGYLTALDAKTGAIKWQKKVSDYVGFDNYFSRNAPAIDGDYLVVGFNVHHTHAGLLGSGDQVPGDEHSHGADEHDDAGDPANFHGAYVAEVSRANGNLRWVRQVEKRTYAAITGNPVVRNGRIVVGISSNEWDFTGEAGFSCCSSRGSVVALDARTGNTAWQTYTIPDTHPCTPPATTGAAATGCSFSGGSVASTPAIDTARNTVYVGTGQNYTVPDTVRNCITAGRAAGKPDTDCADPANHFDSLLALDFATGRIKWAKQVLPFDPWNAACVITPGSGNCPQPFGPDADLISSPNLFTATVGGRRRDIVGSGQKSGTYWALDRDTGQELWHTNIGPGSTLGGIEWGTAVDNQHVIAPIANPFGNGYGASATDGTPLRSGSWTALDRGTGKIAWRVNVPGDVANAALGSPAVANNVVFASSIAPSGNNFFALNAADGKVLWSFPSGGSSISSPAIVDGVVYWGTGYSHLSLISATSSNKFYAFSVDGK